MNFARALARDLVDKRLWPVAVLLIAALLAVPFLLGSGGGSDEGAPVPAAAVEDSSADIAQTASAVELVGPPAVRSRAGKVIDPFRRPPKKETKEAAAASSAAPAAPSDKTTPTPETTDTTPVAPPAPVEKPFAYRTEIRFGSSDADHEKAHGISRLTPLGGLIEPAAIYLGVSPSGKRAMFLLGPSASANGEGTCYDTGCRIIGLRAGGSTIVDVAPADGSVRQYALDVVSVQREQFDTPAVAARARAHVHPDGRDVLRYVIHDGATATAMGTIDYSALLGVLVARQPAQDASTGGTPLAPAAG